MRQELRNLYFGKSRRAKIFRYSLLAFDVSSILFFIASSMITNELWINIVDAVIAVIIATDLCVRLWINERPLRSAMELSTLLDVVVILSLILPAFFENLLFLRVLRALRLLLTYRVLADLRNELPFFQRHEEVILAIVNLAVFVFVMTAIVFVSQQDINDQINNYVDALYFTVTALTTTGYGDIVMRGTVGRLISVIITVVGVALFLRMVQAIFRPSKVHVTCTGCGLNRHETDAIHCKHCGRVIMIETEGLD